MKIKTLFFGLVSWSSDLNLQISMEFDKEFTKMSWSFELEMDTLKKSWSSEGSLHSCWGMQ